MDPLVNVEPAQTSLPSSADWSRLQPVVKELYQDRGWPMAQVRDHLKSLGYRVNTRMIRARISQWNLQRNNQIHDMVAALRLLDPDPALWPGSEPLFLIRGRRVAMSEVRRYFRRKGIQNPIQWCRSVAVNPNEPTVSLLRRGISPAVPVTGPPTTGHTTPVRIPMPIFTLEQIAAARLRDYCAGYLGLGFVAIHQEPEVHQFTTHGRFGDRMQEGLAQMMRGGPGAFPNFRHAFDLVQPLLSDCHPMSLAQLLVIACELSACRAHSVLTRLLRYSAAMASSLRTVSPSVTNFLLSLSSSPPAQLQTTIISSLRAALAIFSEQSPHTWHHLYLTERLCDCLYHGKDRTEGSARRAQLLREQETFYGPFARNVLWTVTNVADDNLDGGDLDCAERYYMMVLTRAEHLSGFPRAKLRYAALEGLGRTERMRFDHVRRSDLAHLDRNKCVLHLQRASLHVEQALKEAQTWFEPTGRRVGRVVEQQEYISNLLQSLRYRSSNPS